MFAETEKPERGNPTRLALLQAATNVFSEVGFDAASTRAIADAAGVNQALIGYHFGGKDGIYTAVFDNIVTQARARLTPALDAARAALKDARNKQAAGADGLKVIARGMLAMIAMPETEQWARLIIREQQSPSRAFDILYEGFMGKVLETATLLVAAARPDLTPKNARLLTLTILSQVFFFRMAHAGILRHMKWQEIGRKETAAIEKTLITNIDTLLSQGN